ncbi:MAG: gyrase subunit B protein [Parcubacteria group bacterium GW2011_GWA2_47_8]|nr:MAG: gyrase subunit B protein [Parcubacteria group bacterium GW2011_GWA2_47_8]
MTAKLSSYSAKDIQVLEGLDPVRKRPGMYIGSTDVNGLHHLVWEVADNSIDEAMAGFATNIVVTLLDNNRVRVDDNGRGIPIDIHEQTKKSALETVMTTLHAGGKFGGEGYQVSGGLHGVGVSVVNALSVWLRTEVHRDGKAYEQVYERGVPKADVKEIGTSDRTGTIVEFEPDSQIFMKEEGGLKEASFSLKTILDHLRQQAYLTRKLRIRIIDERSRRGADKDRPTDYTFYFEGGTSSYVRHLNKNENTESYAIFSVVEESQGVQVDIAFQYSEGFQSNQLSFANNIHTVEGGTHLTGFRTALTRTLNKYGEEAQLYGKDDDKLTGEDVQEGLTAVVSVRLREPQFEGQTKAKLGNAEVRTIVETTVGEQLYKLFKQDSQQASRIISKALLSQKARQKARAVRDTILKKGVLSGLTLPGKLTDCSTRDPEKSELFIVEGDSAGGSAKQARNPRFQAILPLRGKILNVERARLNRILEFSEIKALVVALGTAIADEFDITKLRYHKVIITVDRDVDGEHIETLLLTLFYRYFKPLIDAGNIYVAQSPLYKMTFGKQIEYAYSESERADTLSRFAEPQKVDIQRYKGLGEMNPEQLWETTMDPERRVLKLVTVDDAQEANQYFDILMGNEVAPRRKFIQSHAKEVAFLDV